MVFSKINRHILVGLSGVLLVGGIFLAWPNMRVFFSQKFFVLGNYYFSEKAYNLNYAEKIYKIALRINSETPGAHYQLARIYFLQGKFKTARNTINGEIEKQPEFKRSFYVRGLINGYDGKFPEAVADFEEFLKWKPESWAAHNDLAWVYFQVGDFDKVLALADDGLKDNPKNPWLLNTKGLALYNLKRKGEAKEYLTKALEETEKLRPEDWKMAYPGNDPQFSAAGLKQMLEAIKLNKNLAI